MKHGRSVPKILVCNLNRFYSWEANAIIREVGCCRMHLRGLTWSDQHMHLRGLSH